MTLQRAKRLEQYALTIPIFLGSTVAHGQIAYTDLNPDIVWSLYGEIYLDFNEDGVTDINFFDDITAYTYYTFQDFVCRKKVSINTGGVFCSSAMAFTYDAGPTPLGYGKELSSEVNGFIENDRVLFGVELNAFSNQLIGGNWGGDEFYYLGIKVYLDKGYHFGWIRLMANIDEASFIIDSYAYNKVPKAPIRTGQTDQNTFDFQIIQSGSQLIAVTPDFMNGNNYNLQIFDSLGKVISKSEITINEGFTIDMNHLPNGIYFIAIDNGEFKRTAHISYFN